MRRSLVRNLLIAAALIATALVLKWASGGALMDKLASLHGVVGH